MSGTDMIAALLRDADLEMVHMIGTNLTSVSLSWENLENTNLSEARLVGVDLKNANLTRAIVDEVYIANIVMNWAVMECVSPSRADNVLKRKHQRSRYLITIAKRSAKIDARTPAQSRLRILWLRGDYSAQNAAMAGKHGGDFALSVQTDFGDSYQETVAQWQCKTIPLQHWVVTLHGMRLN